MSMAFRRYRIWHGCVRCVFAYVCDSTGLVCCTLLGILSKCARLCLNVLMRPYACAYVCVRLYVASMWHARSLLRLSVSASLSALGTLSNITHNLILVLNACLVILFFSFLQHTKIDSFFLLYYSWSLSKLTLFEIYSVRSCQSSMLRSSGIWSWPNQLRYQLRTDIFVVTFFSRYPYNVSIRNQEAFICRGLFPIMKNLEFVTVVKVSPYVTNENTKPSLSNVTLYFM